MSSEGATSNRAVRKGCHIGCYSILRSEGPTPIVLVFRCRTYSAPFPTSIHIDSPIGLPFSMPHLRRSQITPSPPHHHSPNLFQTLRRKVAKFFLFYEHGMHEINGTFLFAKLISKTVARLNKLRKSFHPCLLCSCYIDHRYSGF